MTESSCVPVVVVARVLLPGDRASLPVRTAVLPRGAGTGSVVAVFFGRATKGRVGVLATVEATKPLDDDVVVLTLHAQSRVEATEEPESGLVRARTAEDGGRVTQAQTDAAVAALRRYLGSRSEYGEPVDIYPVLPRDPILASYAVASLLDVSTGERQTLLEAGTAERRLALLERILTRERTLLEATMRAKGI